MMGRKYVKEVALLGVDRRKINDENLPSAIKEKLRTNGLAKDSQLDAAKLLDILTYNYYYSKRGQQLDKVEGYENKRINESKSYCDKRAMDVYAEIVDQDYHVKNELLKSWIAKVNQRGEIIPPNKVLDLIDNGIALDKESKKTIANIVGNRGRHILTLYKKKQYEVLPFTDQTWLEGSIRDRKAYYIHQRKEQIARINERLLDSWKSEGQQAQLSFLKILSTHLDKADFTFLEKIYTSEYEGELIHKKGMLSSKLLVCSMLARLDYAPLMSAVRAGLSDYVHQVRASGIVNSILAKKINKIQLPEKQDDFWNGDYLNRLMGFDTQNMNIKLFDYDPYYWMNSFISTLPFSFWIELLNRSELDVVKYFLQDSAFQTKVSGNNIAMFQDALIFNAIATNNTVLADAISSVTHNEDVQLLVPLMSQVAFEKYITKNRLRTELSLFETRSSEHTWSLSFSKNMVSELFNMCKSGRFIPHVKFGRVMARYFHKDAFGHLAEVSKAQEGTQWYNAWLNNVLEPIRQSILIRERINTL